MVAEKPFRRFLILPRKDWQMGFSPLHTPIFINLLVVKHPRESL